MIAQLAILEMHVMWAKKVVEVSLRWTPFVGMGFSTLGIWKSSSNCFRFLGRILIHGGP